MVGGDLKIYTGPVTKKENKKEQFVSVPASPRDKEESNNYTKPLPLNLLTPPCPLHETFNYINFIFANHHNANCWHAIKIFTFTNCDKINNYGKIH